MGDAVHVARHEEGQRKAARMSKESARSARRYSGESSFPSSINLCVRRRACGFACVRVCLKGRRGRGADESEVEEVVQPWPDPTHEHRSDIERKRTSLKANLRRVGNAA